MSGERATCGCGSVPVNADGFCATCEEERVGIREEELVFLMLNELHANVPQVDRPLSWSDLSDDQAQRARNAVRAVLTAAFYDEHGHSMEGIFDGV